MKVTVENIYEVKELPFPKLMISKATNVIVFFEKESCGQIISSTYTNEIGQISKFWLMEHFEDFKGKITLEQ